MITILWCFQLQSKHVNSEFENKSEGTWTSVEDDRCATMSYLYGMICILNFVNYCIKKSSPMDYNMFGGTLSPTQ